MVIPVLAAFVDLVLPRRCVGCGRQVAALCPQCVPADGPLRVRVDALQVVAATAYSGAVRRALISYKEHGRRDLAGPLGGLLAASVRGALGDERAPPPQVVLVPIPSARPVAAARGGDHLARLATRAGAVSGVRVAPEVLALTRAVRDSAGLGVTARARNLHGALRACSAPADHGALLVDDIVTSGATLREAHRALTGSGWPVVGAAVVAATPRWVNGAHWQRAGHRSSVRGT